MLDAILRVRLTLKFVSSCNTTIITHNKDITHTEEDTYEHTRTQPFHARSYIHIYIYTHITYTRYMTFYTIKVSLDNTLKQFTRFMRYRIISLFISAFIP